MLNLFLSRGVFQLQKNTLIRVEWRLIFMRDFGAPCQEEIKQFQQCTIQQWDSTRLLGRRQITNRQIIVTSALMNAVPTLLLLLLSWLALTHSTTLNIVLNCLVLVIDKEWGQFSSFLSSSSSFFLPLICHNRIPGHDKRSGYYQYQTYVIW